MTFQQLAQYFIDHPKAKAKSWSCGAINQDMESIWFWMTLDPEKYAVRLLTATDWEIEE